MVNRPRAVFLAHKLQTEGTVESTKSLRILCTKNQEIE
jgi:hypothetical protein